MSPSAVHDEVTMVQSCASDRGCRDHSQKSCFVQETTFHISPPLPPAGTFCLSLMLFMCLGEDYTEVIVNSHLFLALWPVMGFCVNWCPGPKKKTLMMRADKMPNLCCLTQEKRKSMQMRSLSWCCQNFMFCHGSSCNASFFSWYLLLLPTAALAEPANRVPLVRWEKKSFPEKAKSLLGPRFYRSKLLLSLLKAPCCARNKC